MVRIRKKVIGKQEYYYLEHTVRINGRVKKKELYLGKRVPKDIELVKKNFMGGIYKNKWRTILEKIKAGFLKELVRTPKSARKKETETFGVRFTYDTQRIEGSTLTSRETAELLERGITPKGKPVQDVKEAEAHRELFNEMLAYKKDVSLQPILEWHKKLFQPTKPDIAGKVRVHQAAIPGSKFVPPFPAEVFPLLREFFKWYSSNEKKLHPVELASLAHLKFVTIHPFADGNGRMSRLLMNFVLNRNNYPLFNIPYENRSSYYNALERSQISKNENIFVVWFVKKYIKENGKFLKVL